jgi:hypothetical protein
MFNLSRHFQNAVQPLVQCALNRDPAARRTWLNELRTDCPTVAREVERLLQHSHGTALAIDEEVSGPEIVPGSLEHLGLRC